MPDPVVPRGGGVRRGGPSARGLAAAALVCGVAIFGVLALRVREGQDPALGAAPAAALPDPSSGAGPQAAPSQQLPAPDAAPYDPSAGAQGGGEWSTGPPTTRAS